jgi:hypothetical protein
VIYYGYLGRSRHMQEKLFHDRKQSLRVFVIDSLVYVAIYALLIAVGYQDVTVLMIFHGSIFHIVTFHLDAFGPVFIDLVMNHWKARHSSNSDSTTTPIPSQNQ